MAVEYLNVEHILHVKLLFFSLANVSLVERKDDICHYKIGRFHRYSIL